MGERAKWLSPLRWAALATWLAIPVLGLVAQPVAGRLVWTVAVASLPLFIVLIGYHRWRDICPLAFFSQIPVRLRRPGTRRVSVNFERYYYVVPFTTFFIGLWLRLIWTNGDGVAIAMFFVLISLVALGIGALFTGKTWCNYICPVSFIEKIYTEPRGLRETPNSQCEKCTACKKACPDIDQENGFWKEIDYPAKRFVYFAYPGLVFGFYFYYFLQSGTWDYYFGGTWTDEPGVILHAFLPGTDARTAGFFFAPWVPRALAASLTLGVAAALSVVFFVPLERAVGTWLRRRNSGVDPSNVRNVTFGIAAFTAFVIFYSFAGQPTLRKLPWLPAYTNVLVVLIAALFLVRRLARTREAFIEQSVARTIIKRWTWADSPPPANLHDAYVINAARVTERKNMYAEVLTVYQDAVREAVADGIVTRDEVQRLESLRDQLQIKPADHERVMARLAEDERVLLTDPAKQVATEKRLQLETYARALERHLESVLTSSGGPDDSFVHQLRVEFGVTSEEHAAVLDHLFADHNGTAAQAADAVALMERATHSIRLLDSVHSPTNAALADLLRRERARAVDRLLRGLHVSPDDAVSQRVRDGLCSDDAQQYRAALEEAQTHLQPRVGEYLAAAHAAAVRDAAKMQTPADAFSAHARDADPFVRAVALYGLCERGALDSEALRAFGDDHNALVRESALALIERMTTADGAGTDHPAMTTVEKMIALRSAPTFASLGPDVLEELARASHEHGYAPDESMCLEGELADEVVIMLSGNGRAVAGRDHAGTTIGAVKVGDVIGELAVLDAAPHLASVFASGAGARALCLSGSAFRGVLAVDPAVADGVIRTLARRLRNAQGAGIAGQESGIGA